jgi:hypothetical protein
LIVSGDSILSNGVKHLITIHGGFDLKCLSNPKRNELEREIVNFGPDVIILEQSSINGDSILLRILRDRKKLSIILIDYQENVLHLLLRDEIRISETKDLIEIIGRGYGPLSELEIQAALPVQVEKLPAEPMEEDISKL